MIFIYSRRAHKNGINGRRGAENFMKVRKARVNKPPETFAPFLRAGVASRRQVKTEAVSHIFSIGSIGFAAEILLLFFAGKYIERAREQAHNTRAECDWHCLARRRSHKQSPGDELRAKTTMAPPANTVRCILPVSPFKVCSRFFTPDP